MDLCELYTSRKENIKLQDFWEASECELRNLTKLLSSMFLGVFHQERTFNCNNCSSDDRTKLSVNSLEKTLLLNCDAAYIQFLFSHEQYPLSLSWNQVIFLREMRCGNKYSFREFLSSLAGELTRFECHR